MDHFEEVSEWLGSNSSTPKHANLSLISNVETPSFTSFIAEPVTEPFTLNTAEFIISNSPDEETKNSENRVLLNMRHESSGIKIESNWSSASSTSSQHLTVNTSEYKEIFKTCNVLPFSCTHLALSDKAKSPRLTQNTRLLQISLLLGFY